VRDSQLVSNKLPEMLESHGRLARAMQQSALPL
jgi:hypothetical protein